MFSLPFMYIDWEEAKHLPRLTRCGPELRTSFRFLMDVLTLWSSSMPKTRCSIKVRTRSADLLSVTRQCKSAWQWGISLNDAHKETRRSSAKGMLAILFGDETH